MRTGRFDFLFLYSVGFTNLILQDQVSCDVIQVKEIFMVRGEEVTLQHRRRTHGHPALLLKETEEKFPEKVKDIRTSPRQRVFSLGLAVVGYLTCSECEGGNWFLLCSLE